jgi:large subunit ribosomal protein L23
MNQEKMMQVLLRPVVSEKSTALADSSRQFVFQVARGASKPEVRQAVEKLFNVQVEEVRLANVKGKAKRFGAVQGRRKDWKKAYVRLKAGFDIDFAAGA